MSRAVEIKHLLEIYAATDDPWEHRCSDYEAGKFASTAAALPRIDYASCLEIGCGNGELARRLAPRCDAYVGLDAVPIAIAAAERAVPSGRFVQGFLPCLLPDAADPGGHDLIVLSEVLYFLSSKGIRSVAGQIGRRWPGADIICVTWLGPSGNPLEGGTALSVFIEASRGRSFHCTYREARYRIDVSGPVEQQE